MMIGASLLGGWSVTFGTVKGSKYMTERRTHAVHRLFRKRNMLRQITVCQVKDKPFKITTLETSEVGGRGAIAVYRFASMKLNLTLILTQPN